MQILKCHHYIFLFQDLIYLQFHLFDNNIPQQLLLDVSIFNLSNSLLGTLLT